MDSQSHDLLGNVIRRQPGARINAHGIWIDICFAVSLSL